MAPDDTEVHCTRGKQKKIRNDFVNTFLTQNCNTRKAVRLLVSKINLLSKVRNDT